MNRHRRVLQQLAEARPAELDALAYRADPATFIAYPQEVQARPRTARRRLLMAALAPTVGLVALATVLVLTTGTPGGVPVKPSTVGTQAPSARQVLLAAAEKTMLSSTVSGRYWVTKTERGNPYRVGSPGEEYTICGRQSVERWLAQNGTDPSYEVEQWLGAAPASGADKAAWVRDGSPTSWTLKTPPGAVISPKEQPKRRIEAKAGPVKVSRLPDGAEQLSVGFGHLLSLAELRALPTDPAQLKALLIGYDTADGGTGQPDDLATYQSEMLFFAARDLLITLPVSPQVRAAAYRMLADLPGITALGTVTDQQGRPGSAVAHVVRSAPRGSYEDRLIIDLQTGRALAEESRVVEPSAGSSFEPGALLDYTLMQEAGFTDEAAPRP
jgi:hypothetical protein